MDPYVQLAKQTIEEYIKTGKAMNMPKNLPREFYNRQAGTFVTIFNGNRLRGCIGTFLPTKNNIAEEIISNAISACSKDYRFTPITENELPRLNYEVSILNKPTVMRDLAKHDVKKHGIIVLAGGKSGLLLPDLDSISTPEEQIAIAARKAGIDLEKDNVELLEFEVEKH